MFLLSQEGAAVGWRDEGLRQVSSISRIHWKDTRCAVGGRPSFFLRT